MKGQVFYCTGEPCQKNRWYIQLDCKYCSGQVGYRRQLYCHVCGRIVVVYTEKGDDNSTATTASRP